MKLITLGNERVQLRASCERVVASVTLTWAIQQRKEGHTCCDLSDNISDLFLDCFQWFLHRFAGV